MGSIHCKKNEVFHEGFIQWMYQTTVSCGFCHNFAYNLDSYTYLAAGCGFVSK